ncbi:MAG TPA: sigma-70 family RNA polymerase sigma factor [Thermoleophilaceae bacterium]|nr:sigma-70 family RNA polymerase sigma factor [Thermoleophilaceae bacterium]
MAQALDPPIGTTRTRSPRGLLALRGERHLVVRLRAGDEAAFEVLYDRYASSLLSFCRHMLGRTEEAEDAVQQVFASAHAALQRDTNELELKPWLYAIARNRCLSMLRARREHPDADVEPSTAGLQEQVQTRADLRQLVADLGDLPENQRAALLLTELEDLSHAEAATVLDCEPSQVKGLVFRAREGLIERREARSAPCEEIRAELSTARRGGLRRGRLRHHLAACPGCTEYLEEVRRQRRMMALILPVIPATGLKRSVLAAAGFGTGAGGAGGLTVAGGSLLTGTVAKVAAVTVLAGGAGVATKEVVDHERAAPAAGEPAQRPGTGATPAGVTPAAAAPATRADRRATTPKAKAEAEARRKRAAGVPAAGRRQSRGKSRSNRGAAPPGLARRPAKSRGRTAPAGKPVVPPGQIRKQQTPAAAPKPRRGTTKAKPKVVPEPARPQKQKAPKP